ncbi:50S ribosomal protein L7ae-like protein [Bacillus kwashiorkori]|uniref:50S ribosomal protein L7ae-like protein n=1 Tax=Bacillus kwashiorkori TaxID=1522318 RepID=UPI000785C809|nr:50S ribosomal protein L7ae-like protein [Bacillus kwashiorkori]
MSYEKVKQAKEIIIGTKQTIKALKNGTISELLLANDTDQHIIDKIVEVASECNVPITRVDSMKKLGAACGIDVGAAVVAVVR